MTNPDLATVGEAFANIAAAIAECVRHNAQKSRPPVELFEECLTGEVRRLHSAGEDGLAASMEAIRAPLSRLMTEGW